VLGVYHDSIQVEREAKEVILLLRPRHVGLELCERRFKRLFPRNIEGFLALDDEIKKKMMLRLPLGREQFKAALTAHQIGAHIHLCDQDVKATERKFLAALPPEVIIAGSFTALNWSRAASVAAWAPLLWRFRSILKGRLPKPDSDSDKFRSYALQPARINGLLLLAEEIAKAPNKTSKQRQQELQEAVEKAIDEEIQEGKMNPVEAELERAAQTHILDYRDEYLWRNLCRMSTTEVAQDMTSATAPKAPEKLETSWKNLAACSLGVVGIAHLDGFLKLSEMAATARSDSMIGEPPTQLPFWRTLLGQPLLWRLRGTLRSDGGGG